MGEELAVLQYRRYSMSVGQCRQVPVCGDFPVQAQLQNALQLGYKDRFAPEQASLR